MKRVVSALLLGTIVLSSLPWEVTALTSATGSAAERDVALTQLSGGSGERPASSELPVDECACLCGMCAASGHATASDIEAPRGLPTEPAPDYRPAAGEPDVSSVPSGLFRPPKHG